MTAQPARTDIPDVQQLTLVDVAPEPAQPPLTPRQAEALAALQRAGYDGLHTDELGATLHAWAGKHHPDAQCQWCGPAGQEVGKALRAKGLAQQRRRRAPGGDTVLVWTIAGELRKPQPETTYDLPEGY